MNQKSEREIDCYYVLYESLIEQGHYNAGGGGYLSLEQAKKSVENCINQKIEWKHT